MPKERIFAEPLTNAEKQQRHREKHTGETLEAGDRRRQKLQDEIHEFIDKLNTVQLYAIKPLLRCLTDPKMIPADMEKLIGSINGNIDYEMCIGEFADSD